MKVRTVSKTEVLNLSIQYLIYIFSDPTVLAECKMEWGSINNTFITTNTLSSTSVEQHAKDWFLNYSLTLLSYTYYYND